MSSVTAHDTAGAKHRTTGRPTAKAPASATSRLSRKHREWVAAGLFLAPDALGLLVFVAIPMVLSVVLSLFQVSGFGSYQWAGLGNYDRMFHDPLFWQSMKITGLYVVVLVPVLFCLSLALGLLVKQKLPGVGAYRTALFMPYVISLVVVGVLWKFMLDDQVGVVNKAMRAAGFAGASWLGSPGLALASANWNAFVWPLVSTNDQSLTVIQLGIASFATQAASNWNYILAAATVAALPMLVLFFVFQRQIVESIKTSGLK